MIEIVGDPMLLKFINPLRTSATSVARGTVRSRQARLPTTALGRTILGLPALALVATGLTTASNSQATAAQQPTLATEAAEALQPGLVSSLSTETSSTYREPDGSYTTTSATDAINYQDPTGDWQVINNELVDAPGTTYAVENADNDFTAQLPTDASAAPVRITSEEGTITMRMHGVDAAPDVEGATATYTDVADASSVTYETTGSGVKENIVLDQAPATAEQLSYAYTIKLSTGLVPQLLADGSVQVQQDAGATAFVIPAGNMSDSASPESSFSQAVDYTLVPDGSAWTLTVTPDMDWLTHPARVYPVRIDPSVLTKSIQRNCWVDQANPSSNGCGINSSYLRVGGASGALRRTVIDFDTTAIPASATVNSADLKLYLYAAQGTSTTTTNYGLHRPGKSWNNGATWSATGVGTDAWSGGTPGAQVPGTSLGIYGPTNGWRTFNATSFVSNWKNGTWPRDGILIRQEAETTPNTHIAFASGNHPTTTNRPELVTNYTVANAAPQLTANSMSISPCEVPCGPSPELAIATSATPTLIATFSDVDTPLTYTWEIRVEGQTTVTATGTTTGNSGVPATWQAPSLPSGIPYEFRVTASDGSLSTVAPWWPFVAFPPESFDPDGFVEGTNYPAEAVPPLEGEPAVIDRSGPHSMG